MRIIPQKVNVNPKNRQMIHDQMMMMIDRILLPSLFTNFFDISYNALKQDDIVPYHLLFTFSEALTKKNSGKRIIVIHAILVFCFTLL